MFKHQNGVKTTKKHQASIHKTSWKPHFQLSHTFSFKNHLQFYRMGCCSCYLVTKSCLTLFQHHGLQPTRLLCPWDFPGKNTGLGCHFLLPGIFQTQRSNPHFLCWQADSLPLSHQGAHFHYWLKPFSRAATDLGLLEPEAKNQEVAPDSQSILKHSHPDPCPLPSPPSLGAPSLILCWLHLLAVAHH